MSQPSLSRVDRFQKEMFNVSAFGGPTNYHVLLSAGLLFLLSNALFAVTALRPAPAAFVLAGCAGVGWLAWRPWNGRRLLAMRLDCTKMALCLALGLALCLLGGQSHVFYAVSDWLIRDAVLADLVRDGAPSFYLYDGQGYYLRAPLGMYLLPAAVGGVFGLYAAHVALLLMNAFIFGSTLYLATVLAGGPTLVFLAIVIGFSGLDLIGDVTGWASSLQTRSLSGQSLEWWTSPFAPRVQLQYSSMLTQIFWAPNHAAPGWFIAILFLLRARGEIPLSALIAACAPLVLWSPFTVLGAVPFVGFFAAREPWRNAFSSEILLALAAGISFLPIAIYLVTGTNEIPQGWQVSEEGFVGVYIAFLLIEIPHVAVIVYAWRKIDPADRGVLVVAILILIFLPLYSFGSSNDLLLRASIPSLFLVAYGFARIAGQMASESDGLRACILFIVFLSAVTPIMQVIRPLTQARYAISECNMLSAWQSGWPFGFPTNYLASAERVPEWLLARHESRKTTQIEYRDCWPDHPFRNLLRSDLG